MDRGRTTWTRCRSCDMSTGSTSSMLSTKSIMRLLPELVRPSAAPPPAESRAATRASRRRAPHNRRRTIRRAGCRRSPVLSIGNRSRNHPAIAVRSIAAAGKSSLAARYPSRMRPVDSIRQLMPVLTLRTTARRFSTARKTQIAACCGSSLLGITRPGPRGTARTSRRC